MRKSGNTAWVGLLIFLILFFWQRSIAEVVSVGFMYLFFDLGGYALTSHTPDPSQEGRLGCCFSIW